MTPPPQAWLRKFCRDVCVCLSMRGYPSFYLSFFLSFSRLGEYKRLCVSVWVISAVLVVEMPGAICIDDFYIYISKVECKIIQRHLFAPKQIRPRASASTEGIIRGFSDTHQAAEAARIISRQHTHTYTSRIYIHTRAERSSSLEARRHKLNISSPGYTHIHTHRQGGNVKTTWPTPPVILPLVCTLAVFARASRRLKDRRDDDDLCLPALRDI